MLRGLHPEEVPRPVPFSYYIIFVMQYYYTYVLLSLKDKMFYTGYTARLEIRIQQHKAGLCYSTKDRRPLVLIYFEACLSRQDALTREKYLKSGMGKRYIRNRLKTYLLSHL